MNNELKSFVLIDVDHPGAVDRIYRARRNKIAEAANKFWERGDGPLPLVKYLEAENQTWRFAKNVLDDFWPKHAFKGYVRARELLAIESGEIPQMRDLSGQIERLAGWRLAPIAGLVNPQAFLSKLADGLMLCTQYIRHHSKPEFTPEPDLIHEFLGHVPTFLDEGIRRISLLIGQAARRANADQLKQLEMLYWFTLEYGLVEEGDKVKLLGAGLLAGIAEQKRALGDCALLKPFKLEEVLAEKYDFTSMQPHYYVLQSVGQLEKAVREFVLGI